MGLLDDVEQEPEERLGGRESGHPPLARGDQFVQVPGEHRLKENLFVRKVPVHGAGADTGPARDLAERDVESLFGERLTSGGQHLGPVAAGVCPVAAADHCSHVTKPLVYPAQPGWSIPDIPGSTTPPTASGPPGKGVGTT